MPSFSIGRRAVGSGPLPGDVGAERVEPLDEPELAVTLELEPGGQRQIAAAALAGDDDALGIDADLVGVRR